MEQLRFPQHEEEADAKCRCAWMKNINGEPARKLMGHQNE